MLCAVAGPYAQMQWCSTLSSSRNQQSRVVYCRTGHGGGRIRDSQLVESEVKGKLCERLEQMAHDTAAI